MKRWKIARLIVLVLAGVLFALKLRDRARFASLPGGSNTLASNLVRMGHGEIGFWLTGNVVRTPVTDWSFIDSVPNIKFNAYPVPAPPRLDHGHCQG